MNFRGFSVKLVNHRIIAKLAGRKKTLYGLKLTSPIEERPGGCSPWALGLVDAEAGRLGGLLDLMRLGLRRCWAGVETRAHERARSTATLGSERLLCSLPSGHGGGGEGSPRGCAKAGRTPGGTGLAGDGCRRPSLGRIWQEGGPTERDDNSGGVPWQHRGVGDGGRRRDTEGRR